MGSEIVFTEHLLHLTKFVSSLDTWEEEQMLYQQMDEFLIETFDNLPHMVFSHSVNEKGKPVKARIRGVWNKNIVSNFIQTDELFAMVKKLYVNQNSLKLVHKINYQNMVLYLFNYGQNENQLYWGVIPTLNGIKADSRIFDYLAAFLKNSFRCIQDVKKVKHASSLAFVDDITGFYNHRKLVDDIEDVLSRYKKIDECFAVLFIDIDHFKDVNDGFGHLVGTQLLTDFADRLREMVRETDYMYRYGGDEFVVILTNTKYINIKEISERILSGIKNKRFKLDIGGDYPLSISIGIARYPEDATTGKEIINIADEMMYAAKKQGRGRVCLTSQYFNKG